MSSKHLKKKALEDLIATKRTPYPDPTPLDLPDLPSKSVSGTSHDTQSEIQEFLDSEEVLDQKVKELADLFRNSSYPVVYTGAGISTSASIPDYRGPKGVWTLRDRGQAPDRSKISSLEDARPTLVHLSLRKMVDEDLVKYIVSTNLDNLHVRSGLLPLEQVAELHGNCFIEYCIKCQEHFLRPFSTSRNRVIDRRLYAGHPHQAHLTGRKCSSCKGELRDNIVNFGENLVEDHFERSIFHSDRADLALVVGTSMRVTPACNLPESSYTKNSGNLVIINLQKTPYDRFCGLRIWARSDVVFEKLMAELNLTVPEYDPIEWTLKNPNYSDPRSPSSSASR